MQFDNRNISPWTLATAANRRAMPEFSLGRKPAQVTEQFPTAGQWQALLARFEPISLPQMDDVALLTRADTKFVLTEAQLYRALAAICPQYRVLDIAGLRLNHYQSLYFDTTDFALYRRHQAGGRNRYKIRSREYIDSRLSFLEVKHKIDDSRTIKNRVQTAGLLTRLTPDIDDFIEAYCPLDAQTLAPKLWNCFYRITLVSAYRAERLTLDLNLRFGSDNHHVALPGVVIAEVKQAGLNRNSDFMRHMRAMNIRPDGFSKYCVGVSLLYPAIKHNRFKPSLQLLDKLMKGPAHVCRTH